MLDCYEEFRRQARDGNYIIDEQTELRLKARDGDYIIEGEGQLGQQASNAKDIKWWDERKSEPFGIDLTIWEDAWWEDRKTEPFEEPTWAQQWIPKRWPTYSEMISMQDLLAGL